MKVTGWFYEDSPRHSFHCSQCRYQFTVVSSLKDENGVRVYQYADVYEQCGHGPDGGTRYLIRYSPDGPDYASGIDIKSLCAKYVMFNKGYTVR